ncbi:hypothetical protein AB0I72_27620 [Nocardiopsis sp. NPDC049922]|uniref:hypothetical protein n=1 Tax=Nocardiopsis sp. NPDC049922 TaxID=3155157 RepID=UPI0033FAA769
MIPPIASRIPLVRRPKAPALPLDERMTHLAGLAVEPAGANHRDLVARACGVLNYAALIVSDLGIPDLAADLCWRQHQVFADSDRLTGDIAVMALMPLVNISRLLTRQGDGEAAYDVLNRLYRAAQQRTTAHIHGRDIDLARWMTTDSDHQKVGQELWSVLLVDGARALARIGRWTRAAEVMTAHRGIGHRLLDGRQIMIMSLMEQGLDQRARDTIEATTPTEPWESAIAALLGVYCCPECSPASDQDLEVALREATTVVTTPDPSTAVFQTRVGLAALDLAHNRPSPHIAPLQDAIAEVAALDAYAAREVLDHPTMGTHRTREQKRRLNAVLTAAGLGTGELPRVYTRTFTTAVDQAEDALRGLLS